MVLSQNQKQCIDRSSRSRIHSYLEDLVSNWENGFWLSQQNRYRFNCIENISYDAEQLPGRQIIHSDLCEYIAASIILHCFDGWSLLGRALHAELAGDCDSARHLGYYAELRAAMSLLAGEGIGVFDKKHVIVDDSGRCIKLPGRNYSTHWFVWDTLEYWASTLKGIQTTLGVIRPGGIALEDWLDQFSTGYNFLSSQWLTQWGLDIQRLAKDRDDRNLASYRPTAFTTAGPDCLSKTIQMVSQLWYLCEPIGANPFSRLDQSLLRRSLRILFKNVYGLSHIQASKRYKQQIEMLLNNVSYQGLSKEQLEKFLTKKNDLENDLLITYASRTDGPENITHSKQVLARAFLLLRVASGSAKDHLEKTVPDFKSKLEFWWSSLNVSRTLWPVDNQPSSFLDLWKDIEDISETLRSWLNDPNVEVSHYSLWKEEPESVLILGTPERVALWGLGL